MQYSSAVYLIDRKGLSPSPTTHHPPSAIFKTNHGHHDSVHLPQASIRAPLSSSTARSCPFPIIGKVLMLIAPAAMPLEITVETPAPCKTNYRSHSLVVIVTRTLRKYNANLTCAMEPFWVIVGTAAHILVAQSRRFPLSALQRTLGHTVEQCIASKAQSLCHACTRDR